MCTFNHVCGISQTMKNLQRQEATISRELKWDLYLLSWINWFIFVNHLGRNHQLLGYPFHLLIVQSTIVHENLNFDLCFAGHLKNYFV